MTSRPTNPYVSSQYPNRSAAVNAPLFFDYTNVNRTKERIAATSQFLQPLASDQSDAAYFTVLYKPGKFPYYDDSRFTQCGISQPYTVRIYSPNSLGVAINPVTDISSRPDHEKVVLALGSKKIYATRFARIIQTALVQFTRHIDGKCVR